MSNLIESIRCALPQLHILENEPLRDHCSFRIGGPAEVFAEPASIEELKALLKIAKAQNVPTTILGNGTNVLIDDDGIGGIVIKLGEHFAGADVCGCEITAQAGITLARLAVLAQKNSLTGLEFAHGIPGSLGGAVVMNAGAYGGEMKDVIVSVTYLTRAGEVVESSDNDFSYRHSRFSETDDIVLGAKIRLAPGDSEAISARMRELMGKRSASQPLDRPSAGSTFKRPAVGYAAALIDEADLKGFTVGGAQVSEKHAGFVINTGNATFSDVLSLMGEVSKRVHESTGITLEPEVRIIRR